MNPTAGQVAIEPTFAESLRLYADWCDAHPTAVSHGEINLYGTTGQQAREVLLADISAEVDPLNSNREIAYIKQQFGKLKICHVVMKAEMFNLAIENNKVVSVLKPEFAELVTA